MIDSTSEDILKHIINDIVTRATHYLKRRKLDNAKVETYNNQVNEIDDLQDITSKSKLREYINSLISYSGIFETLSNGSNSTNVSETLAAFIVRSAVLNPENHFNIDKEFNKGEVERLIQIAVNEIITQNSPVMETVKMQVYFDSHFSSQADYLYKEKNTRSHNCSSLLKEIIEFNGKSISSLESLFRKIVSYLLIKIKLGNISDIKVIREATAALESVFPQIELPSFIGLSRQDKETQLNGLAQLVCGIRLFNKYLGKGGESIEDLNQLCKIEVDDLTRILLDQIKSTEQIIQKYSALIDYSEDNNVEFENCPRKEIKNALIFRRQYLMYLDALNDQLNKSKKVLNIVDSKFESTLEELKTVCKSKTAVPVDQVYPQFMTLSNLWMSWQDELYLLVIRRGITETIKSFAQNFSIKVPLNDLENSERYITEIDPPILDENTIINNASILMSSISQINKNIQILHPSNTTYFDKIHSEYSGFCPYIFVKRNELLKSGDRNIGLLQYKDKVYSFSTIESAIEFSKNPDFYIQNILMIACKNPSLIQLFHLYSYFPTVEALENTKTFSKKRLLGQMPIISEIGVQTDTHIVDTYKDPNYEWNEWELRRKAIMLTNLRNKKTHSVQTHLSHFLRESETQHYEPRTKATQTMRESSTKVPKITTYMANLRNDGNKKNKFKIVDLTLDI
ncbi:hypothetical protein BCR36DRAFT_580278 [Piromyces finnis]|uniref:Cilia- and flagella-associated protein 206 n=1 Tax=Piromyces finnis TaxID=1754191 RepID=A0A1Y1VJ28_9FUNG|nr:hypothetical protein BCR36DRAFT_580278 [Piromyces finnis]|eukprot:ORX57722.1 hypothetical protein BCR36DRAFT_580278 [Piromyces finnis]